MRPRGDAGDGGVARDGDRTGARGGSAGVGDRRAGGRGGDAVRERGRVAVLRARAVVRRLMVLLRPRVLLGLMLRVRVILMMLSELMVLMVLRPRARARARGGARAGGSAARVRGRGGRGGRGIGGVILPPRLRVRRRLLVRRPSVVLGRPGPGTRVRFGRRLRARAAGRTTLRRRLAGVVLRPRARVGVAHPDRRATTPRASDRQRRSDSARPSYTVVTSTARETNISGNLRVKTENPRELP